MKKFLLSILCCLLAVCGYAEETATLSFASKEQRNSQSATQQVWSQNGITLTNNKASSTSSIGDYAKPARFYASSEIIIECSLGNITQIEFDCNSGSYAGALQSSIGNTGTVSSDKLIVSLNGSTNSYKVAKLTGQVRLDGVTVTYKKSGSGEVNTPATPTLTAGGNFVGSKEIEISCTTEDVQIYYTTDGTEPTKDSDEYIEPFEITTTTIVKAIAFNEAGASHVATAEFTRVAATPEIVFDGDGTFEESIEVTITPADGTTAYYTLNGKTPNKNSEECPEILTLKAYATLHVIAYDEDDYASPVVKQTFKLATSGSAGAAGTATLVENSSNLAIGDQIVIVATDFDFALSTTQNTNNRGAVSVTKNGNDVALKDAVQILTLAAGESDGQYAFQIDDKYLYAASTSYNHLKTGSTLNNKASFTITIANKVATIKANQSSRNWLRFNSTNNPPLFSCYTEGQADVSIYKVNTSSIADHVLNVTAAGWATLYLGHAVTIPSGVTCYAISSIEDGELVLDELTDVIPASTGVLVKADEGEYTFKVTEVPDEVVNLLTGTTKNEYITEGGYVLSMVDGEVGLYKAKMNGGVFLNNANKAYLPADALPASVQGANGFKFRFETTGVEGVQVAQGKKVIFDLSGRKVNDMTAPGVYIVNGKKVLVK